MTGNVPKCLVKSYSITMDQNKFKKLVANALKVKISKINMGLKIGGLKAWDSLGHLSILSALDKLTKGKASKIKGLGTATSLKKIWEKLKKNNLTK